MDLFSRKIVLWELSLTLETKYVIAVVHKAIHKTGLKPAVIHTDRGIQYTSVSYYDETEGIIKDTHPKQVPGIMTVLNLFMLLLKENGSTDLTYRILIMRICWYSNILLSFTIPDGFTAFVDINRLWSMRTNTIKSIEAQIMLHN